MVAENRDLCVHAGAYRLGIKTNRFPRTVAKSASFHCHPGSHSELGLPLTLPGQEYPSRRSGRANRAILVRRSLKRSVGFCAVTCDLELFPRWRRCIVCVVFHRKNLNAQSVREHPTRIDTPDAFVSVKGGPCLVRKRNDGGISFVLRAAATRPDTIPARRCCFSAFQISTGISMPFARCSPRPKSVRFINFLSPETLSSQATSHSKRGVD